MKKLKDNCDAPEAKWNLARKTCSSSKKPTKLHSTHPKKNGYYSWLRQHEKRRKEPEEREFVVDSGASVHTVSKRDLNSAELETMRTSRIPMTVTTATGEEATACGKELDL